MAEFGKWLESPSGSTIALRCRDEGLPWTRLWTASSAQQAVSFPCAFCNSTLTRTILFHFLCLADSLSFITKILPDIPFWYQTGLLVSTLCTHLAITVTRVTLFTHLPPPLDHELLRAFLFSAPSAWTIHPSQPLSPAGKLFQHLISMLHPPGSCLWPSQSTSGTFYSCAPTALGSCLYHGAHHVPLHFICSCLFSSIDYELFDHWDLVWFFSLSPRAEHRAWYPENTHELLVELNLLALPCVSGTH